MSYTLKESIQAGVIKELLAGADPVNLLFAFRFASTEEGTSYWYEQAEMDELTDEVVQKLKLMLALVGEKE